MVTRFAVVGLLVLAPLAGCSSDETASDTADPPSVPATRVGDVDATRVPNPVVSRVDGDGRASGGMRDDPAAFGYEEREYFLEGTANTYPQHDLPPAPYRSRMIVWTPTDSSRFNGTTVVEWAHVSDFGQFELTVLLNAQAPMLEVEGFAFVLVSAAQSIDIDDRWS